MSTEGMKKGFLERELARLQRNRGPVYEELKAMDAQIKELKKRLTKLKKVKAENPTFLF